MSKKTTLNILSVILFAATALTVVWGMLQAHQWTHSTYGDGDAQVQWNTWVDDVKEDEEEGTSPVARRVPKSDEPPGLVLMRDYFVVCLVISLVLSLALAAVFNFMLRGVLGGDEADGKEVAGE